MRLYYSGASEANSVQNQTEKSLGGYVSSTVIQNGMINYIFSTISRSVVEKNKRDTRLIALTNTTGSTVTGVKIYMEPLGGSVSNVKLAAVTPAVDSSNNIYFEEITSTEGLPYGATLELCNTEVNAIDVGEILAGKTVGIWLSREIIAEEFPTIGGAANGLSDEAIQALKDEAEGNGVVEDVINLVIKWD